MSDITSELQKTIDFLKKEFATLQTGRANSKLIEDIEVELYGVKQPIKHMANISVPDAQSIIIDPWDKKALGEIEKAIQKNPNLGFSINNDGVILRLAVPPLTEERRKEVVKVVHKMTENARISVRNIRHEEHNALKKQKENSEISEDDFFRDEKELQEEVDAANKEIDQLAKKKEAEIMTV